MRWDFWDKYMSETDITMQMGSFFLCCRASLPRGGFRQVLPAGITHVNQHLPASHCNSRSVMISCWAWGHWTLQIGFCDLVAKYFLSGGWHVFSLNFFSVAVYYADVPFHAGLAGGHGFHLSARLHVFQSVDHLPKHHLSGGSQSLLGPSSVW